MKYILTLTTALFVSNLALAGSTTTDSPYTPLKSANALQTAISESLGHNYIAQEVLEKANSPDSSRNTFQIIEVNNNDSCVLSDSTEKNASCRDSFRVVAEVNYSNYKADDESLINLVKMNLKELKNQLLANSNWDSPAYHIFLAR